MLFDGFYMPNFSVGILTFIIFLLVMIVTEYIAYAFGFYLHEKDEKKRDERAFVFIALPLVISMFLSFFL